MRVLHITAGNLFGGVENTLATLARQHQWDQRVERTFAICFSGRLTEELEAADVRVTVLGPVRTRYPWQVIQRRWQLTALLKREAFDAVICHMAWSLAIFGPVIRSAGLPLVFWMHDAAEGTHWIERWVRRIPPDLAIINSRFTARSLPKLYQNPPSHVIIHGPVQPPVTAPLNPAERAARRAELGMPVDDVVIIQIGRMESYKGHALHLDALARLADVPGWSCWIVGGAQRLHEQVYLAGLKAQAVRLRIADRVHFLGERHDVERLLRVADIFCQPNRRGEPFGLVFVEALFAGLPVVGTAIGGVLEIIDESCGCLAPPNDPAALANILRKLIEDPALRARLALNGPARAAALSHPDRVMEQLEAALLDLFERRAQRPAEEHAHPIRN